MPTCGLDILVIIDSHEGHGATIALCSGKACVELFQFSLMPMKAMEPLSLIMMAKPGSCIELSSSPALSMDMASEQWLVNNLHSINVQNDMETLFCKVGSIKLKIKLLCRPRNTNVSPETNVKSAHTIPTSRLH